jgi:hypothetical protein
MQLTHPIYLWALAGILVPLLIHLLSRKPGKVVQVGSIRHLSDSNSRRFSSLRFNEYLLFVLRALLVVIFALLLSGLARMESGTAPRWVLLEPGFEPVPGLRESLDSLQEAGYEFRYLAEGFPRMETDTGRAAPVNYAFLLHCLEEEGVEAVVYAGNRLPAFLGPRRPLPERVKWIQLPGISRERVWKADRPGSDTTWLLSGQTGPERTMFSHRVVTTTAGRPDSLGGAGDEIVDLGIQTPIKVWISAGESTQRQAGLLEAAIRAIAGFSGREIIITREAELRSGGPSQDFIFDLSRDTPTREEKIPVIRLQEKHTGSLLAQTGADLWVVNGNLDRQSVLRENFLVELAGVLLRDRTLEQNIRDWDQRAIDESIFFNGYAQAATGGIPAPEPLDKWLILTLLLIFILERTTAFFRRV